MTGYQLAHAYDTVNLHRRGGAARIELNRPDSLNAWDQQLGFDLKAAVDALAGDDDVRAVVITGAGRAFSSGADLKGMGDGHPLRDDGRPDVHKVLTERYHPIITGIRTMPKPVVAAVNGPAVGIGCSLALCCDLVAMRSSAYLMLAFVNIGLVPDGGSSLFIPARAGHSRAFQMALLGERIDAATAVAWGLSNWSWPDEEFDERVDELVVRLANGPTRSYAGTKRQLNNRIYRDMDDQLELEAQIQQEIAGSGDFVEGVTAFAEKRPARFSGA
jgi:2-(1,2-epoxy-1,2-dihydrophenyl)acetyl-CoA isomerase